MKVKLQAWGLYQFRMLDWGLLWVIFFSVLYQKLVPIGFMLMVIGVFIHPRQKHDRNPRTLLKGPSAWLIAYFLWLLIAMLWTENQAYGLGKIENKLAFLLVPVIVFFGAFTVSKKHLKWAFIAALFVSLLTYESIALARTICCLDANPLFYFQDTVFVSFMHRSYYSAFLQIGILFLVHDLLKSKRWILILPICFLLLGNLQTLSKAGMLCMAIFFICILFYYLRHFEISKKKLFAVACIGILGCWFLWKYTLLPYRLLSMKAAIENIQLTNNPSVESNTARILSWYGSLILIKEKGPLGCGTGDYSQDLVSKNASLGNTGIAEMELNSHNQFLTTTLQLGWLGVLILGMIFFSAWRNIRHEFFDVLLLMTYFIHFLFESYLETQAGVVLFAVFLVVYLNPSFSNQAQTESAEP